MRRDHRRILAIFRSCNLPLAVETGRYTKLKTPISDRLSKFCNGAAEEDVMNYISLLTVNFIVISDTTDSSVPIF